MIKLALPSKGRLLEPTIELLSSCGYQVGKRVGSLSCVDDENDIEFYFLRPVDIPIYISDGTLDGGVTGKDFVAEKGEPMTCLLDLGFGHSKLCAAVAQGRDIADLRKSASPMRVATAFPTITRTYFDSDRFKIVELEGSVEVSVKLGIADAIVDVVETGNSMQQAGLKIVGEPVFLSSAAVFCHPGRETLPELVTLLSRLKGKMVANEYMMVEYDVPEDTLTEACAITPGIQSPTIMTLDMRHWFSVKSVVRKKEANRVMDELARIGCKGIILTRIESARM